MFERLAKFWRAGQQLKASLSDVGRFHPIHLNDSRPGSRHPERRRLRSQQALTCRWSLASDGRHLECVWEPATPEELLAQQTSMPLGALG